MEVLSIDKHSCLNLSHLEQSFFGCPKHTELFFLVGKQIKLVAQNVKSPKKGVSSRDVIYPPPDTICYPCFDEARLKGTYYRGSPSPLTKELGSLHSNCALLRRIIYSELKAPLSVTEMYPQFDSVTGCVVWHRQLVVT